MSYSSGDILTKESGKRLYFLADQRTKMMITTFSYQVMGRRHMIQAAAKSQLY